eukprot:jgi/Orpsp1_1/1187914/evm.model.d7180000061121.1
MKFITSILLSLAVTFVASEPDFCSATGHKGKSLKITKNKSGILNGIGYELWAEGGTNSATFYEDGSFSCSFEKSKDYLCRSGLSFDDTKTHKELGHMYADFKLVKQNVHDVSYSYVGVYGWTKEPLVEYYIVDDWLSRDRPGKWVGDIDHGDFTIDGARYTVYTKTRNGPSIIGDTTFTQIFSIRESSRSCATVDITAHFELWESLGLKLGKFHEAKILGEAGSIHDGTSGTADFPYAKVYIGDSKPPVQTNSCSDKILANGYKCCSDKNCEIVFSDSDGTWGVENNEWCGCDNVIQTDECKGAQGYPCCKYNKEVFATDADGDWSIENDDWCLIPKM